MSSRTIRDKTGIYVELPKEKIKFVSKEAETIYDLSLENDYLKQENTELKKQLFDREERLTRLRNNAEKHARRESFLEYQQQEFIKYLEEMEKQFDRLGDPINSGACCGILQKYKEIIGDVEDEN